MSQSQTAVSTQLDGARHWLRTTAIALFIVTLAWAPFPLGGAIPWAAGLQEGLVAVVWILWVLGTAGSPDLSWSRNRVIFIPALLALGTIGWAVIQITPGVPKDWVHPVWSMASDVLHRQIAGVISLSPWRTEQEVLKLVSYLMAAWLAFSMGRRAETAKRLATAVIVIGSAYVAYAFMLEFLGYTQVNLFYTVPYKNHLISGPFMLHNSFATYSGLVTIAAVTALFAKGGDAVARRRGWRQQATSVLSFCFGSGAPLLAVAVLCFAGVVASASRAGFAATLCGLFALALASAVFIHGQMSRRWSIIGTAAAAAPILFYIAISGGTLWGRVDQLLATDTADAIRLSLWESTRRMIADAPTLGLGLGSFEDAYPMYASQVFPFVMDKAHCDYLEFAAGLGLPAASAWWLAMVWLFVVCVRGLGQRHRDRRYSAAAIGATVLIAVHSCVDFSLQLPSVAFLYATLLGLGVAQSQSSKRTKEI